MNFPVFDLHCDTALELLGKELDFSGQLRKNDSHIDLERAGTLPGYAQCFACFTTPAMEQWYQKPPAEIFEREMICILRQVEKNADIISLCYNTKEVEKNLQNRKMSAILTIEGPAGFGFNPEMLEDLYKVGFRITTLGWNEENVLAGSHITGGGLTDLGREYVREAQRLGMIVDVSHLSDEGFWDIMDITRGPVIASHSNARAVHHVSRNLTDDMFKAICRTGGVAGLNLYTDFLGENATLDTACDHILHWMELGGAKHIALGGDLDGCETLPADFAGVQDYEKLAQRLLARGMSEQEVYDLFWNNAMGVMENAVCDHTKQI